MLASRTTAALFVLALLVLDPSAQSRVTNVDVSRTPGQQNEPTIAIDSTNPLNLVVAAHDYRNLVKQASVYASLDGGLSWSGSLLNDLDPTLTAYEGQGDCALAALRAGVFYLSYIDHDYTDGKNRLVVARSDDGGRTWPRHGVPEDHPSADTHFFEDKPFIAVDDTKGPHDGNVYLSWVRDPPRSASRILFTRSLDGAATFTEPVELEGHGAVTGPVPVVGPDGEVYVAWRKADEIHLAASLDGGATFGPVRRAVTGIVPLPDTLPGAEFRVSPFPSLAVDRSARARGTLYLTWADGEGPDVWLARSSDGGSTWSTPLRVSDDTNHAYQFFPSVVVGPGGVVSVVFHDQRASPNSPRYDTYAAHSFDAGQSFQPNLRVSDETSDASLAGFRGTFIGDYLGIAASPLGIFPVWTDVRPSVGNAELFVRRLRVPQSF